MKLSRLLSLAACLAALIPLSLPAANATAEGAALRVMSFNVRMSAAKDGPNAWPLRHDMLFATITAFHPTLIGFQEVLADQYDEITARMAKEYTFVGVAREDGKRKGEWALVGYRTDRFEALDSGNFWLSEHPEVPNSKSWETANTRICTWVRLRDRANGRELVYANTHFDHKSAPARAHSSELVSERLAGLAKGAPVILTGDFNMTEDDPSFAPLAKPTGPTGVPLIDSYREVHPKRSPDEASFNGFKGTITGSRIDFIFHSAGLKATAAEIVRTGSVNGRWASDHYAVTAMLNWNR